MTFKKKWLFAVPLVAGLGYLAVNPVPLYAFLGLGDIVFDPTSYATFGKIWGQDVSNGVKLAETFNQTVKIVSNGLQLYNITMQMAKRIDSKQAWETAMFAMGNEIMQSHYNETINFNAVMNGDVLHAAQAWHQSTLNGGNAGYLGNSSAQSSSRMANYSTLQLMDQTSQRCAQILANYKSTQDSNALPESKLYSDTFDMSDAKNSLMAGLNVLAGGHIHTQTQLKANGNVQACLAEQATLQAKLERDNLAVEQGWYSDIATERANGPSLQDPTNTALIVGGGYLEP
jgi:hypothetical protein